MPATSRAMVLKAFDEPLIGEELRIPEPGPGAALARVDYGGICGTDVHLQQGRLPIPTPIVMGHEAVGRIERLGAGLEHDVLGRFIAVADALSAKWVMRITGDCPFLAPEVCERVLQEASTGWDYVSNDTTRSGYPDGLDCEVVIASALRQANRVTTLRTDREHVTPWVRRNCTTYTITSPRDCRRVKLSVDALEDLERARRIYGFLAPGASRHQADACREQD